MVQLERALGPRPVGASTVRRVVLERKEGQAWSSWTAGTEPVFSGKGLRKACVCPGCHRSEQKLQTTRNSGELGAPATEQPEEQKVRKGHPRQFRSLYLLGRPLLHRGRRDPHHLDGVHCVQEVITQGKFP